MHHSGAANPARVDARQRLRAVSAARCRTASLVYSALSMRDVTQNGTVVRPAGTASRVRLLRPRNARESAALLAFFTTGILTVTIAARIADAVAAGGATAVLVVVAALATGVLASDLVSGLVHWACDTFFTEATPLLGAALIAPFREHHRDPLAMTRRRFLDVNSSNCFAVVPLVVIAAWRDAALAADPAALFTHAALVTFAPAMILTNQCHQWAHDPRRPMWVRRLQRWRVVLPPETHARHHTAAHGTAYCVTGGWLNPWLDRVDAFGRAERVIRAARLLLVRAPRVTR
jgi:ubiquitin-conjugating enzyme E2 variant